jgi:cupin 2 domain-containing protein
VRFGRLLAELPERLAGGEDETVLLDRPGARLVRIVSTGHATPPGAWYDQPDDEWVAVLTGAARLLIEGEGEAREFGPGDWIFLPARCRHRVVWTDEATPTVWLALHVDAAA